MVLRIAQVSRLSTSVLVSRRDDVLMVTQIAHARTATTNRSEATKSLLWETFFEATDDGEHIRQVVKPHFDKNTPWKKSTNAGDGQEDHRTSELD